MDFKALTTALKKKSGQHDVDFVVDRQNDGTVRLVKVRHTFTPLTNYVKPEALVNYINESLADKRHNL